MVDFEQKPEYLDFVNERIDTDFDVRHARCIASVTDHILGVVVFSRFSSYNCEWTAASVTPMFLRPPFIQACFRYAFIQCNLHRISAIADASNTKSHRLLFKLGFVKECDLEQMFGANDGILFKMLKRDCRWLHG